MILKKISLKNYRNILDLEIKPCENVNIIYGKNAQGKTNLLESIWMLTGTRSFRATKDKDIIKFDKDWSKITGQFFSSSRDQEIIIEIKDMRRKAYLNGIDEGFATNIIGTFRVIIFSPMHLSLIKGGPDLRRRLIDAAICQLKPTYTRLISGYNHILRQRNSLLKSLNINSSLKDTLDIWNQKLISYGSEVIFERLKYLKDLKKISSDIYSEISQSKEKLSIDYGCCVKIDEKNNVDEIFSALEKKLSSNTESDISNGFTSVGPHRDDVIFSINSKPIKTFGSQGQQRSSVLAVKLSEAKYIEEKTKEKPLVLLDDVMSELDLYRREYITEKIKDYQVFITSCEDIKAIGNENTKKFLIDQGKVVI